MLDRKMVINELRKRGYIAEEKNVVKNGVLCDGISIHLPETKMENEKVQSVFGVIYNDSAQKTPAVRKNVRGMNAPITNNATIIPTGFSSGIVGFSWPDVLQNAVIRCIALLFQEKHFR